MIPLLVPGVLGFAYPYVMQPHLVGKHQASAYFGMMVALVPLLTILVSAPMLGVWPRRRQVIGVLLGLACIALLASDGEQRSVPWYDLMFAMTVPLSYAVSNTYIKKRFHALSPLALTCSGLALAGLVLLPISLMTEQVKAVDAGELTFALTMLVVLGVFGTGLAMFMFYRLIQSHGPLFAGMVTYLVPLGALMWGWLDGERVTMMQLVAMAGIFAGVALVQWPGRRRRGEVAERADLPTRAMWRRMMWRKWFRGGVQVGCAVAARVCCNRLYLQRDHGLSCRLRLEGLAAVAWSEGHLMQGSRTRHLWACSFHCRAVRLCGLCG